MRNVHSAGILIKSGDKYLLAHATGQKSDKGWGIPKGRLDEGEDHATAAVREVGEEVGLDIPKSEIKKLGVTEYKSSDEDGKIHKILTVFIHEGDESLQTQKLECASYFTPPWSKNPNVKIPEIDDFKWVTLGEAKDVAMKSIKSIFDLL